MTRDEVMSWVAGYERVWRSGDVAGLEQLFTEAAEYRVSPYEPPIVGRDAIEAFWQEGDDDEVFSVQAEPVAVEGTNAVARLEVRYGDPVHQEYRDLWVLRFAPDGRVEHFEEWPFWPGKPFAAATTS
jgi:hypothetical protein